MDSAMRIRTAVVGISCLIGASLPEAADARSIAPPIPVPWVIETADYTGNVTDRVIKLQAVLTINVLQDGWAQIPLTLNGATITKAELVRKAADAHIMPQPGYAGQYVLAVSRKGTYKIRMDFSTRLQQDSQYEGVVVGIPQASFSTLSLVVPRKDVELRETDKLYVERHPDGKEGGVTLKANLASTQQMDVRWATKPTAPITVEPMIYGEVHTLAVLEEQLARLTSIIDYRITQGEIKALTVQLPANLQVLNVRGAGIEDWRVADESEKHVLHVTLNFPLKETTYRLLIEGEQALEAKQVAYPLPEMALLGIKQERGQIAVAVAGSLEVTAGTVESLNRIDVKEVSDTLKNATVFPILMAFRYHQHPYHGTLSMTHYEDLPVLNAVAEQGELVTILSAQGELMTRAAYVIRANKRQFLGVRLPEGATLWSCIVGGRSVKPVNGEQGQLLVPLSTAGGTDQGAVVELVYFESRPTFSQIGRMKLNGPILDIPTTVANWLVYTPRQMKWLRVSGNLEPGASSTAFVEDPFAHVMLAATSPESFSELRAEVTASYQHAQKESQVRRARTAGHETEEGAREDFEMANAIIDAAEPSSAAPTNRAFARHSTDGNEGDKAQGYGKAVHSIVGGLKSERKHNLGFDDQRAAELFEKSAERMQEAGILPLKIRLPKAGTLHTFNRLMTAQESLELEATFVNLPTSVVPFGFLGFGMVLASLGGVTVWKIKKS